MFHFKSKDNMCKINRLNNTTVNNFYNYNLKTKIEHMRRFKGLTKEKKTHTDTNRYLMLKMVDEEHPTSQSGLIP